MTFDLIPYLPFLGVALGVAGTVIVSAVREKNAKVPTIGQIWERMDALERRLTAESRARVTLKDAFLGYIDRMRRGGSIDLTAEERVALELEEPVTTEGATHV